MRNTLSRRFFLTSGSIVVLNIYPSGLFAMEFTERNIVLEGCIQQLVEVLSQYQEAIEIGTAFLEQAEQDFQAEMSTVINDHVRECEKINLEQKLKDLIQEDFQLGRLVDVYGWQLSQTEVFLCVLAALWEESSPINP